jgi:DNA/RNA-binding domain of Phe-tRNA-synthetase-like protein
MSVKYLTPFGGENLDVLQGDFCLYVAKGGEIWFPIGGGKAKPALAGELVWGDDVDLSTRALNWRQCDRTKMTETTTNGFFIMDGFDGVNKDVMMRASEEFVQHVTALCGGSAVIYWLDRLHSSSPDIMI